MIDWGEFLDNLAALGASVLLGGLVGLERELRGRWAGMRTHMMVSLGAALFVLGIAAATRGNAGRVDAISRVIQGLVAGIGFLGAGTILKLTEKHEVKGLTTAGSIWLTAAVGVTCGLKLYALAVSGVVVALVILGACRYLERAVDRAAGVDPDGEKQGTSDDKGPEKERAGRDDGDRIRV
jgi:putative Mg2+ transporter-C (MgtC) family protein